MLLTTDSDIRRFRESLLIWYDHNKREMPWRGCEDPYQIWISEIMLQQTQVKQVEDYFLRFIEHFPTVKSLAEADQDAVLKVWEGLGYYSRARNLHAGAKMVVERFGGNLPNQYENLIKIKGIGPYSAAAIASIAFSENRAVVDGNVIRVLTRIFDIDEDIKLQQTQKRIQNEADQLLDNERPGDYNQAVMELGTQICKKQNPVCDLCPLNAFCSAYLLAKTDILPYKSKSKPKPHKEIGIAIITDEKSRYLIAKRPEHVMLGGLWEFPGGKQEKGESVEQTIIREIAEELGVEIQVRELLEPVKHIYSHFSVTLHPGLCDIINGEPAARESQEIKWVEKSELKNYAFPKANIKIFKQLP